MPRLRKQFLFCALAIAAKPCLVSAQRMADRIKRRTEEAAGRTVDRAVDKAVTCPVGETKLDELLATSVRVIC